MTAFIVAYDLINETSGYDYKPLWKEFDRLGAQKTQYSVYLVSLNNTAQEVHDHFKKFLDADDRLWVAELTKKRAYSNAIKGTNAWIEKNAS